MFFQTCSTSIADNTSFPNPREQYLSPVFAKTTVFLCPAHSSETLDHRTPDPETDPHPSPSNYRGVFGLHPPRAFEFSPADAHRSPRAALLPYSFHERNFDKIGNRGVEIDRGDEARGLQEVRPFDSGPEGHDRGSHGYQIYKLLQKRSCSL